MQYVLNEFLIQCEEQYDVESDKSDNFGPRFSKVIRRAYEKTGRRVVILVDEYDKPLLQAIGNPKLQDEYRAIMKGFYDALKSMDGCIRFDLLTGVTKFGDWWFETGTPTDLVELLQKHDYKLEEMCG